MAQKPTPTKPHIRKPPPPIPTWIVLVFNVLIIGAATLFIGNRVSLPCVTPFQVSTLSLVCSFLIIFHLVWRFTFRFIPKNPKVFINFPVIKIPLSVLIKILNSVHPWKLTNNLLLILSVTFLFSGYIVNFTTYSPFYEEGEPFVIQSFVVRRPSSSSPEQLAPNGTLTLRPSERVILEIVLLGETQVSCTWFVASSSPNAKTGCSIAYGALTLGEPDSLSVFVKPECGSHEESASLGIVVQP